MKGIFICLWILLLRHTLSADTGISNDNNIHIFTNDDPKYEHTGDIGSPTIAWYMVDGPNLKEITYNGNVQLDSYFLLKATEGNTGYQFNYHGGSFEVGGGQGIFNELASGPTIVNMQGDSFNGKGTSNYTAGVREGSTIYMDFTNYYTQDSYIENFQSVTYSATTNATIDKYILINTDVYILGPVLLSPTYYDSPVLHKSNIWLDSPDIADISGSNFQFGGEGNSGLYIKDSAATKDKEIKLSDSFLDSNNTIAFDTPIQSLNWLHTGLFPGRSGILVVHTTKNTYNISFRALGHHYCLTDKNFKITKTDVNHNGTSIEMFQVTYDPTSNVQCPPPYTVTQEYNIIPTNCFVEDIWVISFIGTTSISYIEETMITICKKEDYTTTIDKGNGDFETDLVSHITTKDSNGNPTTIVTTIPLTKPSGEADYTTTIDKGNGDFETDLVSHITTKDSNGNPTTIVTTIPLKPSDAGEADYTTTIDKGNGDFETDLVSHITTKDSNGKPTTIITTVTLVEEPVYTAVFVSDGHTITAVVSHVTTTNDIGQTVTTTVTVISYDQVGEGVYTSAPAYSQPPVTTTTVSADTTTATVVISYFPSIGVDGVTRTGTTTVSTVSVGGEADYTTTVDRGNGSIETDVISHITTTDSNGNPTTITTTITNAPAPSISKANIGSDYTTTVVSNGHTFTEVVSHSTGTDEHGHTIVSTVTQTVGVQSHGSTVSSAAPASTVSGAESNAPGTAGVGGIVNSQKPQSQNVAGQGSGNEKPTQAAGTAGGSRSGSGSGSGSGSVHQSAGNIVPSGSPSVQSAKGTASPVSGIHGSQTPHSVPSQAQQQGQGQGQGQAPSSRQQAATTVLLSSGSSVDNIGSGFSSTQTASVLQGKGASIRVASSSIVFSMIVVIVFGMI